MHSNIVVYISHDTGKHIGPYGVKTVRTPNADRVAAEGALFVNSDDYTPKAEQLRRQMC